MSCAGTVGLVGPDISQEELDFSDLFLYADNDFPTDDAKDDPAVADDDDISNCTAADPPPPSSSQPFPSSRSPDHHHHHHHHHQILSVGPPHHHGFGLFDLPVTQAASTPRLGGTVPPAPSPRIEITPSGESFGCSHPLSSTTTTIASLHGGSGDYRECAVSPASSNSSVGGGWLASSPCVSPGVSGDDAASVVQGWSALDGLCPGLQEILHTTTTSPRSSPGASPRTSITEETFLQPRCLQRATSSSSFSSCCFSSPQAHHPSHHHERSRSLSPQGKRTYDRDCGRGGSEGGSPAKQRSRSPSPVPHGSPVPYPDLLHGSSSSCCQLPRDQAPTETQLQLSQAFSPYVEEIPRSCVLPSNQVGVQTVAQSGEDVSCLYQRVHEGQNCDAYGVGVGRASSWRPAGQNEVLLDGSGAGAWHVEPLYVLPTATLWPPHGLLAQHQHHDRALSGVPLPPPPPPPPLPGLLDCHSGQYQMDWSLPSQSGQYQLHLLRRPRSHHRAHYETEGSRGAVKTPDGGHPEVQLRGYGGSAPLALQVFIGTADERVLRPHPFYRVHRILGKSVTTPSAERTLSGGVKVLEVPLQPRDGMRAVIDCAGILKLRNADIELRNGETDLGRKNTRVRMVFRVHVPEPGGQIVSLQVMSEPIECSQRTHQELPAVERQDVERCSVLGGQQMVLTGQHFTADSKVMFCEKTQDGQQIWEVEATVDRGKSQSSMLFVEVPSYRDPAIDRPAKVNFYVINGKKRRSQPQHFTYTPLIAVKSEPVDDYQFSSLAFRSHDALMPRTFYRHPEGDETHPHVVNVSPTTTPNHLAGGSLHATGTLYGLVPPFPEDPFVYRSSNNNSPVFYHVVNTHYGNVVGSGSSPTSRQFDTETCHYPSLISKFSTTTPVVPASGYALGKSPPSRYAVQYQGTVGGGQLPSVSPTPKAAVADGHDGLLPDKVTVKQENFNHAYLEDVNDIIRRDLKVRGGERS